MKQKRTYDILMILALLMFIGCHFTTVLITNKISQSQKQDYEAVVQVTEANPIAKYLLLNMQIGILLKVLIFPSLLFGLYWAIRSKLSSTELTFYVVSFFTMSLINISNDLAALLGVLLKSGGL